MTINHEDLIAELRACVDRGPYSGGGYLYVEVAPEDATAAADALEQTTASLREAEAENARLRAVMGRGFEKTLEDRDEAYREMHARELHHFEAERLLADAEAAIEAALFATDNLDMPMAEPVAEARRILTRHQDKRENGSER